MQRSVQQTNGDGVLASPRKKQRLSNASTKVTVVLGAQWGDEGKGKVVDMLAMDADVVCRCQVSPPSFPLPPTFFFFLILIRSYTAVYRLQFTYLFTTLRAQYISLYIVSKIFIHFIVYFEVVREAFPLPCLSRARSVFFSLLFLPPCSPRAVVIPLLP